MQNTEYIEVPAGWCGRKNEKYIELDDYKLLNQVFCFQHKSDISAQNWQWGF